MGSGCVDGRGDGLVFIVMIGDAANPTPPPAGGVVVVVVVVVAVDTGAVVVIMLGPGDGDDAIG